MGIKVLPPDINKSENNFSIEGPAIRFGLSAIKNVGEAAIESILTARKNGLFVSFKDFLYRVDLRKVNKKTVESLIKAGAFAQFANKSTLMAYYPKLVAEIQTFKEKTDSGQFDLFESSNSTTKKIDNFKILPEFSEEELFAMEREVIGFLIGKNPLSKFKKIIEAKITKKIGDINIEDNNKNVILAGIISGKKIIKTKKDNNEMAIIQVFDETGNIEVVIFPKIFTKIRSIIGINKIILFKGKVVERDGKLNLVLENAVDLEKINIWQNMRKYYRFDENLNLKFEKKEDLFIKKKAKNDFLSLAKYSSLGYYLIVPILLGIFIGFLFDFLLKTKKTFFIIGFLSGILGTFYNLKKIYFDVKNDRRNN